MDLEQFRRDFPQFADVNLYTPAMLNFWAGVAAALLNQDRWGDLYTQGLELCVAHYAALAARNVVAASAGGVATGDGGALSSKVVGAVNASYDTTSASIPEGGQWNQTVYGRQYLHLARLVGTGCIQL